MNCGILREHPMAAKPASPNKRPAPKRSQRRSQPRSQPRSKTRGIIKVASLGLAGLIAGLLSA
jgi:hypothetical protein